VPLQERNHSLQTMKKFKQIQMFGFQIEVSSRNSFSFVGIDKTKNEKLL
jgi:hypothetical protein